ncbi:hypothetical protein MTR_5g088665 [Medicago truncatula]|uniref:Lipoprotein n=1 Tax=Medicago truncatula TaxID=3880 RepID=A0A072UG44_MEDTR|nr:hypothetical protein MTR_5g088665 [Medicago truncatula]
MNKISALFFMALLLSCMPFHSSRTEPSFQKEYLVATHNPDKAKLKEITNPKKSKYKISRSKMSCSVKLLKSALETPPKSTLKK